MPLAARLWLKQVSEARKLVSANGQVSQEAIPCEGQNFWQNRPAVLPSTYFCQQSSKQEAAAVCSKGRKGLLPGQACL